MGSNFHTPYTTATKWKTTDVNPVPAALDKAITYLKNVQVSCAGAITYNKATGALVWADVITILFTDQNGLAKANTIAAGNITIADNEFVYIDLNETNNTVLTMSAAAVTTASASNFVTFNRLVLGYRNTTSDEFSPVYLSKVEEAVVTLTSASSVTVNWSKGKVQKIVLAHNVAFTLSGAKDGDKLVLRIKQNGAAAKTPTWGAEVGYGADIASIVVSTDLDAVDYLGFIYDSSAGLYHLVSMMKGF